MNSKAQAGMEYLMTYGWALVLVISVISILVFIVSGPAQEIAFNSSDPKILFTNGAMQDSTAIAMLKNATGGPITVTDIAATGGGYSSCTINEESTNISVSAGGMMELNCPISGDSPAGVVTITYSDYAEIERVAVISVSGGIDGPAGPACESSGTGTEEDPFILATIAEVQAIPSSSTDYYELCGDIDASETSAWNEGEGFAPITSFSGSFDGKGHKITGLYINRPGDSYANLFGSTIASGEISNIGLENVSLTGGTGYGGALVGNHYGTINNSYATGGTVTSGGSYVGGLVGKNRGGALITNSYSTVAVPGSGSYKGGFVGRNDSTCTNCFWDTQTSGQASSQCGTGKLTSEMKQQATFTGWDFVTIWTINEGTGYPALR